MSTAGGNGRERNGLKDMGGSLLYYYCLLYDTCTKQRKKSNVVLVHIYDCRMIARSSTFMYSLGVLCIQQSQPNNAGGAVVPIQPALLQKPDKQ